MPESRRRSRTAARFRFLLLLVMGPTLALAACDKGTTDPEEELADITGTWTAPDGDLTLYLEITATTITEYYGSADQCFFSGTYAIADRSGDTVTVQPVGAGFTFDLIIRPEGSGLRLIDPGAFDQTGILLSSTSTDVSTLEICGLGAGGSDPAIDCTALPPITVGGSINGELTNTDDDFLGTYYDLYGLTLDVGQQVTITQTSDQIDPYMYLYQADGTYITEDDDSGGNFNSSITETLNAGCYRIEASSFGSGETGTYTLSVN